MCEIKLCNMILSFSLTVQHNAERMSLSGNHFENQ